MYYYDPGSSLPMNTICINPVAPCVYTDKYSHLKRAIQIEDNKQNILIVPEIVSIKMIRDSWSDIRMAVAWLSLQSGLPRLEEYISTPGLVHIFQSYTARKYVCAAAKEPIETCDICDYIPDEFVLRPLNPQMRNDIVVYNAVKDRKTPEICRKLGVKSIGLDGFTWKDVRNILDISKVYVDLGHHPGRDRIPREAAVMGCVIVTNREGTAANFEDLPIDTRAETDEEATKFIQEAISNHSKMYESQKIYIESIKNQRVKMSKQIYSFLSKVFQFVDVPCPPISMLD